MISARYASCWVEVRAATIRSSSVRSVANKRHEYDGVWNEACARELSVFPTTTGVPPHEFHTYINQQDGVLVSRRPRRQCNPHVGRVDYSTRSSISQAWSSTCHASRRTK